MKRPIDKAKIERRKRKKSYFKKSRIIIFFVVALLLIAGFAVGFTFLVRSRSSYIIEKKVTKYEILEPNYEKLISDMNENNKLPKNLIPFYYQLYFMINLSNSIEPFEYTGSVEIFFKCSNQTNKLIINSKNLEIDENSIAVKDLSDNNSNFTCRNLTAMDTNELLILEFNKSFLSNHEYSVFIRFKGFINSFDKHGLLRLSYYDTFGNKR